MTNESLIRIIDHALHLSKKSIQTEQDPAIMLNLIEVGAALECVKEYLEFESAHT